MISKEEIMDFFNIIKQNEIDMANSYHTVSNLISDPELKKQFLHMEQEEKEHKQIIEDLITQFKELK